MTGDPAVDNSVIFGYTIAMKEVALNPGWKVIPHVERNPEGEFLVSVNELNSFQRCRYQWDKTSASRQSLHRVGMPAPALNIGSAVHFALAAQSLGADPLAAVMVYFEDSTAQLEIQYRKVIGCGLGVSEWNQLNAQRDMVLGMLRAYAARYGKFPTKPYRIVAPEVTFKIPLVKDYGIYLVGTMDRVHVDQYGNPIVGECKTYKTAPKRENWRVNNQIYGYACALQILTRKHVVMALYDGLRKKAPLMPKVLKNGTLSTAWIDTTYDLYKQKLLEVYEGDKSVLRHPAYAEFMTRLKTRDMSADSAFHTRFRVPISQRGIQNWWDQAQGLAMEMAHSPRIYRHFNWQGCPECRIKPLCYAEYFGENTDYVMESFAKGQTHTRQAKKVVTPGTIRSVEDLEAYAGSLDPDRPFEVSAETESSP